MNLTLLLPWFPIILAVGVAGRLLGKTRGIGIGIACALFWIVLAQAGSNHAVWTDPWIVVSLITGSLAIIAMGAWSADVALDGTPTAINSTPTTSANAPRTAATTSAPDPRDGARPEERFAKAGVAAVRMDLDPGDAGELGHLNRLYLRDLHF